MLTSGACVACAIAAVAAKASTDPLTTIDAARFICFPHPLNELPTRRNSSERRL
jgi:hypothetical protein